MNRPGRPGAGTAGVRNAPALPIERRNGNRPAVPPANQPQRPAGVPNHFVPVWVHPKLGQDLHSFFGPPSEDHPQGQFIPHDFAPAHEKLFGQQIDAGAVANEEPPPLPNPVIRGNPGDQTSGGAATQPPAYETGPPAASRVPIPIGKPDKPQKPRVGGG